MYKQFKEYGSIIHIYEQELNQKLKLIQSKNKTQLSNINNSVDNVAAMVNCHYFTDEYELGRSQGNLRQNYQNKDTLIDVVIKDDGTYKVRDMDSWDYTDNRCGFSVAVVLVKDGQDTEEISHDLFKNKNDEYKKINSLNPQTIFAKTPDKWLFMVVDGRHITSKGMNGIQCRAFLKNHYEIEFMAMLDGGGSSEMIVDGRIVNRPSDGHERLMFTGLAMVEDKKVERKEGDMAKHDFSNLKEPYTVLMAHLAEAPKLKVGDKVTYGTVIGIMGCTGKTDKGSMSTGIHLHTAVLTGVVTKAPTLDEIYEGSIYMKDIKESKKQLDFFKSGDDLFINEGVHREAYVTVGFYGIDKNTYPRHRAYDLCATKRGFKEYPIIHWNRSYIGTVVGIEYQPEYYGHVVLIAYGKTTKLEEVKEPKQEIDQEKENLKSEIEILKTQNKSKDDELIKKIKELEKVKEENNFFKNLLNQIKKIIETLNKLLGGKE